MIWPILLVIVVVLLTPSVRHLIRIVVYRLTAPLHRKPHIPHDLHFYWTIRVEKGTIQHKIAQDTILVVLSENRDHITYRADLVDKIEYDMRLKYARPDIIKEEKNRLGICSATKGRRKP